MRTIRWRAHFARNEMQPVICYLAHCGMDDWRPNDSKASRSACKGGGRMDHGVQVDVWPLWRNFDNDRERHGISLGLVLPAFSDARCTSHKVHSFMVMLTFPALQRVARLSFEACPKQFCLQEHIHGFLYFKLKFEFSLFPLLFHNFNKLTV